VGEGAQQQQQQQQQQGVPMLLPRPTNSSSHQVGDRDLLELEQSWGMS
jgi:hypothetical protein